MFEKFVGISFLSWFIVSVTLILEEELVEFWRIALCWENILKRQFLYTSQIIFYFCSSLYFSNIDENTTATRTALLNNVVVENSVIVIFIVANSAAAATVSLAKGPW